MRLLDGLTPLRPWLIGTLLIASAGCSTSMEPMGTGNVSASGTLVYHGEPVAGARLIFWNDDLLEPAFAQTDGQGRFACVSNDTDSGLLPGDYLVTVTHPDGGIPDKYTDAASSPLNITIADGAENILSLKLED
jgi:hypothetical protein